MNRVIKFRAWNGTEMIQECTPLFAGDKYFILGIVGNMVVYEPAGTKRLWSYEKEVESVMQYSGLKDKNGKEIYEGDIVKWGHTHESGMGNENPVRIAEVKISPDIQFHILNYKTDFMGQDKIFRFGSFIYTETEKYLEIIGNIYENPELLTS